MFAQKLSFVDGTTRQTDRQTDIDRSKPASKEPSQTHTTVMTKTQSATKVAHLGTPQQLSKVEANLAIPNPDAKKYS